MVVNMTSMMPSLKSASFVAISRGARAPPGNIRRHFFSIATLPRTVTISKTPLVLEHGRSRV